MRTQISNNDGMLLVHNGIVKGVNREGKDIKKVIVMVDWAKLNEILDLFRKNPGISIVEAYIREGELYVGDDIMYLGVAGDVRENVINTLQAVLDRIKKEVTQKQEI